MDVQFKCFYDFIDVGHICPLSSFPLLSSLASDKLLYFAAKFFPLLSSKQNDNDNFNGVYCDQLDLMFISTLFMFCSEIDGFF